MPKASRLVDLETHEQGIWTGPGIASSAFLAVVAASSVPMLFHSVGGRIEEAAPQVWGEESRIDARAAVRLVEEERRRFLGSLGDSGWHWGEGWQVVGPAKLSADPVKEIRSQELQRSFGACRFFEFYCGFAGTLYHVDPERETPPVEVGTTRGHGRLAYAVRQGSGRAFPVEEIEGLGRFLEAERVPVPPAAELRHLVRCTCVGWGAAEGDRSVTVSEIPGAMIVERNSERWRFSLSPRRRVVAVEPER
ncbi:MAG TPA: hypothetical protein VFI25_12315 [Planctomycetota bacterium]|jgi:hypothetical protein|nr:hypothetical protein [Planctomycetota bacterium]